MSQDLRTKLKKARMKLDLTQAAAAKAWGVPLNTLICWENNTRTPAAFTLARLNHLLDGILGPDQQADGAKPQVPHLGNSPHEKRDTAAGG